jgi:cold shock CspA family protein
MPTGRITKWFDDRGFGFVSDDQQPNSRGVFAHISAIGFAPSIGEPFEFEVAIGLDGRPKAINARPLTAEMEEAQRVFG